MRSDRKVGSPYEAAAKAKQKGPQGHPEAANAGGAQCSQSPTAVAGGPSQEALGRVEAQEDGARAAPEGLRGHANAPVFEDCQQEDMEETLQARSAAHIRGGAG